MEKLQNVGIKSAFTLRKKIEKGKNLVKKIKLFSKS